MGKTIDLRARLSHHLPIAYGVSGPLASPLFTRGEVKRLIATARDQGIGVFDTGPTYGAGEAEKRLGQAVGNDASIIVMTKAGTLVAGPIKRDRDFSPAAIVKSVESSLIRLKRDRIDVLWLHGPVRRELTDDLFSAIQAMQDAGKIGSVGLATREYNVMRALAGSPIEALMAPVNEKNDPRREIGDTQPDISLFGIEVLALTDAKRRNSVGRSYLWKTATRIIRGESNTHAARTVEDAISYAFGQSKCDIVVTTTTKSARIVENAALGKRFQKASGTAI
ncbi:MAG: aldo/keto reductase [Pseudomonadota bacterium]